MKVCVCARKCVSGGSGKWLVINTSDTPGLPSTFHSRFFGGLVTFSSLLSTFKSTVSTCESVFFEISTILKIVSNAAYKRCKLYAVFVSCDKHTQSGQPERLGYIPGSSAVCNTVCSFKLLVNSLLTHSVISQR